MANRSIPTSRSPRPTDSRGDAEAVAALAIRLARRPDGAVLFELRRADGTTTWQKRSGPTAEFFALHDLTHYALEITLGLHGAFYGLVSAGWDLSDFGAPWKRGPLPVQALAAEVIVGFFDTQHAAGDRFSASECNAASDSYFGARGMGAPVHVDDETLDRVKLLISDVVSRWHGTQPGETLELGVPGSPSMPLSR